MELRKKAANMNAGGEERRLPKNRAALYVFLIWTNIMDIFAANLLFLLFSIPVVTAPAALCALSRVMTVMIRNGACPVWREFIREFKTSFWKGMALSAVWAAWMAASYGAGKAWRTVCRRNASGTAGDGVRLLCVSDGGRLCTAHKGYHKEFAFALVRQPGKYTRADASMPVAVFYRSCASPAEPASHAAGRCVGMAAGRLHNGKAGVWKISDERERKRADDA